MTDPNGQVAALPFRFDALGNVLVLLITLRSGEQHWIPPKGNLVAGLAPHEAAAQEAFEKAGILGTISPNPLGEYQAEKLNRDSEARPVTVTLFPMYFEGQMDEWPEKGQRCALWFEKSGAISVVREQELALLIERFEPSFNPAQPRPECGAA